MGWKAELCLGDLPPDSKLEALCRVCDGHVYYQVSGFLDHPEAKYERLDDLEARLRCAKRECGGAVRLYQTATGETEAFVGGLP